MEFSKGCDSKDSAPSQLLEVMQWEERSDETGCFWRISVVISHASSNEQHAVGFQESLLEVSDLKTSRKVQARILQRIVNCPFVVRLPNRFQSKGSCAGSE